MTRIADAAPHSARAPRGARRGAAFRGRRRRGSSRPGAGSSAARSRTRHARRFASSVWWIRSCADQPGVWIARRSAAGRPGGPVVAAAPCLTLVCRSPRRTAIGRHWMAGSHRRWLRAQDGWSLRAVKAPVRGRVKAPGCHRGQDPDQPAGCPAGFQPGPTGSSHVRSAPHSTLACENAGFCHLADVRLLQPCK